MFTQGTAPRSDGDLFLNNVISSLTDLAWSKLHKEGKRMLIKSIFEEIGTLQILSKDNLPN